MKKPTLYFVLIVLATLRVGIDARADEPAKKTAATPALLAPVAFLAVGVWQGTLPPAPDGSTTGIELKAEWTGNHRGVRFESAWRRNGKSIPYTSGLYLWDGAKQQIVIMYTDAEGSLTQGAVTQDGATLVHNFTITSPDGKVTAARSRLTPDGNDAFLNEIFLPKDGTWQKFVEVRYRRAAETGKEKEPLKDAKDP